MTAVSEGAAVARRAKRSDALRLLARVGFVGFGVTHLLVAWLALQIAYGAPPQDGDQYGAFRILADRPFGRWVLIVVGVGLVALAVWQSLDAAVGHTRDNGRERTVERIVSAGRAAFYFYLGYEIYKVVSAKPKTGAEQKEHTAASILAKPGGQLMVALIGLGIVAVSLGLLWYGVVRRFEKHLRIGEMSATVRRVVRRLGVAGYLAKAVAYGTVGVLVIGTALTFDPDKSRGLDAALEHLAREPSGRLALAIVAAGIAAYGVFSIAQARYREV